MNHLFTIGLELYIIFFNKPLTKIHNILPELGENRIIFIDTGAKTITPSSKNKKADFEKLAFDRVKFFNQQFENLKASKKIRYSDALFPKKEDLFFESYPSEGKFHFFHKDCIYGNRITPFKFYFKNQRLIRVELPIK